MTPVECEFEAEVLAAVIQSRWPGRGDAALRAHVAGCAICSDLANVAGALDESCEEIRHEAVVPDSGRVWWVARMRARREATRAAGRPITAAQVLAFACAVGLLGACFGATSIWFQGALPDWKGLFAAAAAAAADHAGLVALALALVLVIPGTVYWVVVRD